MKKILLFLLFLIAFLALSVFLYFQFGECGVSPFGCGEFPTKGTPKTQQIKVGSGPEDMAIDTSMGYPRIIVSCTERRKDQPRIGAFYGINPTNNIAFPFKVIPADLTIHPHGVDVVTIDAVPYLYAISHDKEGEEWRHRVFRFVIQNDSLIADLEHIMEHELMNVPNDIEVLEDGSFYASNYVPSMDPTESTKAIIGMKTGSVVHYDGKGNWEIVIRDMCYPNGLWVNPERDHLWVANGGCEEVVKFKINQGKVAASASLSTKTHGVKIPIGDNLILDNEGVLWVAAHPCPLKFLDHMKDSANKSPMQIFKMDPNTLKTELAFQNNGALISAASTAIHLDNRLYISQVFDSFVLMVEEY